MTKAEQVRIVAWRLRILQHAAGWHINADEAPWHAHNLELGRDAAVFDTATHTAAPITIH